MFYRKTGLPALLFAAAVTAISATGKIPLFLRSGFIDNQRTTTELFSVEQLDCCRGLLFSSHFNKPETTGLIGELVFDNVGRNYFACLNKQFTNFFNICVVGQTAYE